MYLKPLTCEYCGSLGSELHLDNVGSREPLLCLGFEIPQKKLKHRSRDTNIENSQLRSQLTMRRSSTPICGMNGIQQDPFTSEFADVTGAKGRCRPALSEIVSHPAGRGRRIDESA